jgi:fibronectin type 3 domain-containing protein
MRASIVILILITLELTSYAQVESPGSLPVLARVSKDSITLRWAPPEYNSWILGNEFGYVIEKFLFVKNDSLVDPPQKIDITAKVKVWPLNDWQSLVKTDPSAAIVAQALYGSDFKLNLDQSDLIQIVNKTKENNQRFSIALLYADRSIATAIASGLVWTDHNVNQHEKNLFRISVIDPSGKILVSGALLVNTDEITKLPEPKYDKVSSGKGVVNISIDPKLYKGVYTSFYLERSKDSIHFSRSSDLPFAQLSESDNPSRVNLTDTANSSFYFRIRGITPFGESGPPSKIIFTANKLTPEVPPYISKIEALPDGSFKILWEFSEIFNEQIRAFRLERADQKNGRYISIGDSINTHQREAIDGHPHHSNYYRITATTKGGRQNLISQVYFATAPDTIPPSAPPGIKGSVDNEGNVSLTWDNNSETGIEGYKIYKSHFKNQEPSCVNKDLVRQTKYSDHEDLNTLNRKVYYYLMAVDSNQNHSSLSDPLVVNLPDKVAPQPPVFLKSYSGENAIILEWKSGGSDDTEHFKILRRSNEAGEQWRILKTIPFSADTSYSYKDELTKPGVTYYYTVTAVDSSMLESGLANPVSSRRLVKLKVPPILLPPQINREKLFVNLKWKSEENKGISKYRVYRKSPESKDQFVLYKVLESSTRELVDDRVAPGGQYTYFLVSVYDDLSLSEPSVKQTLEF